MRSTLLLQAMAFSAMTVSGLEMRGGDGVPMAVDSPVAAKMPEGEGGEMVVNAQGMNGAPFKNGTGMGNGTHWTTIVLEHFTTYCPEATTITHGGKTYTVTKATTLTISNCPTTLTKPIIPGDNKTKKPMVPTTIYYTTCTDDNPPTMTDKPCTGPGCPPVTPPKPCTGPNCPPVTPPCTGTGCPPVTPPCTGPKCPPVTPPCTGPNCPPVTPPCTGPNCPPVTPPCTGTGCPPVTPPCTGPNCPPVTPPCTGPKCPPVTPPCTGTGCPPVTPPCTGPNCPPVTPPCTGPNCPPVTPPCTGAGCPPVVPKPCDGPSCPTTTKGCEGAGCKTMTSTMTTPTNSMYTGAAVAVGGYRAGVLGAMLGGLVFAL